MAHEVHELGELLVGERERRLQQRVEALQDWLDRAQGPPQVSRKCTDHLRLERVYAEMSTTCWLTGEGDRAIDYGQRALAVATTLGHVGLQARAHRNLGLAYTLEGRVAADLALVEHGVEHDVASGRPRRLAPATTCFSEAYRLAGRLEEARQRATQALDHARQYKQRGHQVWALWLLGESRARQASPAVEPAADHYRQALALAAELGMRPLQAHCHRGLGMLYARLGQREQARAALATAIALYRDLDMTFWLPQAEAVLAQVA